MGSRITTYWDDGTGTRTSGSFGAVVLPAGYKLTGLVVDGVASGPPVDITAPTSGLQSEILYGIQGVPNGNPLLALPADIGNSGWFVVEHAVVQEVAVVWAPSSATATVMLAGSHHVEWRGQLNVGVATEFAFTFGQASGTAAVSHYGSMSVYYA